MPLEIFGIISDNSGKIAIRKNIENMAIDLYVSNVNVKEITDKVDLTSFILDDPLVIEDEKWFSEAIIKDLIKNDSYMLIISRVDSLQGAILEMKANRWDHYCVEI